MAAAPGQSVLINNIPFTVAGVAPPGFFGVDPGAAPDFYIPLSTGFLLRFRFGGNDPKVYLPNAYAIEFLRHNLSADRLASFDLQMQRHNVKPDEGARTAQQRTSTPFRFTAFEEKVLWGDMADVFHLVYYFSPADDPIRAALAKYHFDGVYLNDRKMPFISEDYRSLMLEIWKVKYLKMPRFREIISSIPLEIRLSHFLNDGDSPDIPIPIYIGYLNQIRLLARAR